MLDELHLYNFSAGHEIDPNFKQNHFVLSTCQRTMVLSFQNDPFAHSKVKTKYQSHRGENAYSYLLETICGLQSKLLGENEIVNQFKEAYKTYVQSHQRDTRLMKILEKLFKDSKEIRSQYLIGISQKTYASITRKILVQKHKANHVLIMGSGNLAEDLINQMKKKCTVSISARNTQRVTELAQAHQIEVIPWMDFVAYKRFSHIANSIGANLTLFEHDFFHAWFIKHKVKAFVDLGSPSVINTDFGTMENVYRLDDIFSEGAIHEKHKNQKIKMAAEAIDTIVEKRHQMLREQKLKNIQYQGGNFLG